MKRIGCMLITLLLLLGTAFADGGITFHEGWDVKDNNRVFYEIFVGSFSDSDGDGTGDLHGIINRMDYLNDGDPASGKSLGIEGIWLTPIFLSPSYHKYDVTDYKTVDPSFGTTEDLLELITLCHERDVKLILDLPLNHTGKQHQWFKNFVNAHRMNSPSNFYYDFYTWLSSDDPVPAGRKFTQLGGPDLLYEANFDAGMPELNFDNEAVREAVLDVAKYWLNLGVDGFRFDAAKYPYFGEHDKNLDFWIWYMDELKKLNPEIYTVAEVWDGEGVVSRYLKAFNCFHFATSQADGLIAETAKGGDANKYTRATQDYLDAIHAVNPDAAHVPFIANHDTDRAAGYLTTASGNMQMAANLYILMPGSPFIYYGEEIGLRGSRGGANTDANRRLAMLWGDGDTVQDPPGSTYDKQTPYSVQDLEGMRGTVLQHYRRLIMIRKANPEIARGTYTALSFPGSKAGGFLCEWNGSTVAVIHNPSGSTQTLNLSEAAGRSFSEMTVIGMDEAILEDDKLILGGQTSVVLR